MKILVLFVLLVLVSIISINDAFAAEYTNNSPDADGDGIPDSSDSCPTQLETVNGFQDTDGCPDVVPPTDTDSDSLFTLKIIYSDSSSYSNLGQYNNALNWKRLKPMIQDSNDPLTLLSTISNQLSENTNNARTAIQQINRYNSDGTETKEYMHAWMDNFVFYRFSQDYVNAIINKVHDGMSMETAINQIDKSAEEYLHQEIPEPKIQIPPTDTDSQIDDSIIVTTDKTSYEDGDTIFVIGEVRDLLGYPVILSVIAPNGNLVTIMQGIIVGSDKQFSTELLAGGALMRDSGIYTITVLYGTESNTDQTTFTFGGTSDNTITPTSDDLPDEVTITTAVGSGASPGCEDTSQGCFIPKEVSVAVGGKVIFSNPDNVAHTFTAGTADEGPSGEFDSSLVMAGSSYEWTPTTKGQYDYLCLIHPWMTGIIFVGEGTYVPPTEDNFDLQVIMGNQVYDLSDTATMNFSIGGISTPQNVALEISDPRGTSIISRSFMVDSNGIGFEFKIDENFKTGTYKVVATTSDNGNTVTDTAYFKVKSQYNSFKITSVQVTDQQGNPSSLQAGEIGFIKVNLEASKDITTLVTVNLFDSDLTSIGIGSIKTTLSSGNSEIILSFMIPSDVAVGQSNIYVNAFSDWPSNGGIPLTGEISVTENIE